MIEKAKQNKLRGWSFGFEAIKEHEEPLKDGLKRRFVDEMNLAEVSIIDEHKIPCYVGTSIETRADKSSKIEYRGEDCTSVTLDTIRECNCCKKTALLPAEQTCVDYSKYEQILNQIKGD